MTHAEEMALGIVLEPEQFEKAKIELWRRRGVHALLDPELAARLRLSRAQRNELAEAIIEPSRGIPSGSSERRRQVH